MRRVGEVETGTLPTQAIESSIKGSCCLLLRVVRAQPYTLTAVWKPNFRHPFPPFSLPHSFVHLAGGTGIVGGECVIARSGRRRGRRRRINSGNGRFHHVYYTRVVVLFIGYVVMIKFRGKLTAEGFI
ncbi:hypothetical protein V8G54_036091 [Vigna mungo]|uniref:Uncharacterized protein n=1 Tax=Vigna mungo TaxID=3915 RepID=A0AAQ3MGA3_VIGMU